MSIPNNMKIWFEKEFKGRVRFDEPMSGHTSFRIGGPADVLVFPETKRELALLIRKAVDDGVLWIVIGGGTNLLVKDHGIRGIVISTLKQKAVMETETIDEQITHIRTSAGTKLNEICRLACQKGFRGMNFAMGIPGTVGGAIVMNAGTVDGAIQDVLYSVEYADKDGFLKKADREDFLYSYRHFALKGTDDFRSSGMPVIVEAVFEMASGDPEILQKEAKIFLEKRFSTQPSGVGNAGCFFKNPSGREPAGKLIDLAGLKGYGIGGAFVSEKHANYIVNSGTATADDVLSLSHVIQEKVFRMFQVKLEPEVRIVG
jgi:UDP-N-acetylmuramate dehydrogenase